MLLLNQIYFLFHLLQSFNKQTNISLVLIYLDAPIADFIYNTLKKLVSSQGQ